MRCSTRYCLNDVAVCGVCWKCYSRRWRANNPLLAAYTALKCNAKRRDIPFFLTKEEFHELCVLTNYLKLRGKTPDSMSIDRIVDSAGYVMGNLNVITLAENTRKRHTRKTWSTRVARGAEDPF